MITFMPQAVSQVAAFILAGGKSTRMGTDKAFIQLNGRTLLDTMLETARSVTSTATIIGSAAKFSSYAPVVEDVFHNCGPLGGIHAALSSSAHELNLVLAVDLPFLTRSFLEFLMQKAASSPSSIVTVPRTSEGWQPLCALYRREFAQLAEEALRAGRYKIDALFDANRTRVITEHELQAAGFSRDLFRNLNTPQDVANTRK